MSIFLGMSLNRYPIVVVEDNHYKKNILSKTTIRDGYLKRDCTMNRNPQKYQPASSQGTWKSWTGKDSVMGYAPVTTMDCEYV